jgi:CRP-like cAMP-binding protein
MMLSEGESHFLLEHAAVRGYRRRHVLFDQGDDATCLFVVLAGEVEVFVEHCQGRTVLTRKEIGELELLDGQDRPRRP